MICRTCLRARLAQRLSSHTSTSARLSLSSQSLARTATTASSATPVPTTISAQSPRPQRTILLHQWQQTRLFSASSSSPSYSATTTTPAAAPEPEQQASSQETSLLSKPEDLTEGEAQVWDILIAEFAPTQLLVQDISGGCGSMYGIDIASEKFRGLNMLKQQRLVNAALGPLVKEWHGLQLKTRAP